MPHTLRIRRYRRCSLLFAFAGLFGLAPPVPAEVPPIAFAARKLSAEPAPGRRTGAVERATAGSLLAREPGGLIRALVDRAANPSDPALPLDVMDPDVSYDGARIVFAGYSGAENAWRIYEIGVDGKGLHQITETGPQLDLSRYGSAAALLAGHDDLDPCYLPDGRICFVSTRYPGVAPDDRLRTTNLYVVDADGGYLHRITTERFGADTPAVDPKTGQIVYSRWWRTAQASVDPNTKPPEPVPPGSPGYDTGGIEFSDEPLRSVDAAGFPGVNSWFLSSIDPDGTDLAMFSGFRLDRNLTQAYRPSFLAGGSVLALFIPRTPFLGFPRGNGLREYVKGPSSPTPLGGPQQFERNGVAILGDVIVPFPSPTDTLYASAAGLPDGTLLVSAALPAAPKEYGIYIQSGGPDRLTVLVDKPGIAELDAVPVLARPLPARIADKPLDAMVDEAPRTVDEAFERGGSFTFLVENIFFNAPVGVPIVNAPPVGKKLFMEFYTAPQLTSTTASDPPLLIRRVEVPPSGRIEATLPGGVPLFEVLRRPDGTLAQGRDGQIFHVGGMNFGRAGEKNRCVGCHAGHSQMAVPEDSTWTNLAPSAVVTSSSDLTRMVAADFIDAAGQPAIEPENFPFFGGSIPFRNTNVVDRKLDPSAGEWASQPGGDAFVSLRWNTTLSAREVVIYGPAFGEKGMIGFPHEQVIHGVTVRTLRGGSPVQPDIPVPTDILPEGTRVGLDPAIEFDALEIHIKRQDVAGKYELDGSIALAEIEVIARATGLPRTSFIRGDVDCTGSVDLADPIFMLNHMFLGGPVPCCNDAVDANSDQIRDISDPIFLLNFLFVHGAQPEAPFPRCTSSENAGGDCQKSACF